MTKYRLFHRPITWLTSIWCAEVVITNPQHFKQESQNVIITAMTYGCDTKRRFLILQGNRKMRGYWVRASQSRGRWA